MMPYTIVQIEKRMKPGMKHMLAIKPMKKPSKPDNPFTRYALHEYLFPLIFKCAMS